MDTCGIDDIPTNLQHLISPTGSFWRILDNCRVVGYPYSITIEVHYLSLFMKLLVSGTKRLLLTDSKVVLDPLLGGTRFGANPHLVSVCVLDHWQHFDSPLFCLHMAWTTGHGRGSTDIPCLQPIREMYICKRDPSSLRLIKEWSERPITICTTAPGLDIGVCPIAPGK